MVERHDHAARTYLQPLRNRGDRGGRDRRIGVEAAKSVEVPFRGRNGYETVSIGELGAFDKQPIFFCRLFLLVAGKIKQTELHRLRCGFGRREKSGNCDENSEAHCSYSREPVAHSGFTHALMYIG